MCAVITPFTMYILYINKCELCAAGARALANGKFYIDADDNMRISNRAFDRHIYKLYIYIYNTIVCAQNGTQLYYIYNKYYMLSAYIQTFNTHINKYYIVIAHYVQMQCCSFNALYTLRTFNICLK